MVHDAYVRRALYMMYTCYLVVALYSLYILFTFCLQSLLLHRACCVHTVYMLYACCVHALVDEHATVHTRNVVHMRFGMYT
jgi:hypothetical protein